ncbi:MAG: Holliday junction branch migration protein RuvA [Clostridia bacterium]|nr:Holliday junction branch migration protein RuvA [Clostridia bacterium]
MFYYIKGELVHTEPALAVIDTGGVAYAMTVSATTSAALTRLGETKGVKLLTHLIVREDGVELFGFYTDEELRLFKMLITVSGVGPKAAVSILSTASVHDLIRAIVTGNQKAISAAQGVGAKTAARIILELKDKLGGGEFDLSGEGAISDMPVFDSASASSKIKDAENALLVLGYTKSDISSVLRGIDVQKLELEDIIKLALAKFMKK